MKKLTTRKITMKSERFGKKEPTEDDEKEKGKLFGTLGQLLPWGKSPGASAENGKQTRRPEQRRLNNNYFCLQIFTS